MTPEQRAYLGARIQSLKSRQKRVGPFRAAGIQRTLDGMKEQLRRNVWLPPVAADNEPRPFSPDKQASSPQSKDPDNVVE